MSRPGSDRRASGSVSRTASATPERLTNDWIPAFVLPTRESIDATVMPVSDSLKDLVHLLR